MTATASRAKLGAAFRGDPGTVRPMRDILLPPPAPASPQSAARGDEPALDERPDRTGPVDVASDAEPVKRPPAGERRPSRRRRQTITGAGKDTKRVVPTTIDVSVYNELKVYAAETDLSYGTIVLRAVEGHADELSTKWSAGRSNSGGLFRGSATVTSRRRREQGAQVQLTMLAPDADTLDRLVRDWAAPSRSELVTEALRLHFRTRGESH